MFRLLDLLFPPRADDVVIRDVSIDDFLTHLSPLLVEETRSGTVALLPFRVKSVRSALHEAKYHGSQHAFALLAAALEAYLSDLDERAQKAVLVPVPLSAERLRERGYNQVEEVVRCALCSLGEAGSLQCGFDPSRLVRIRDTASQVSLRGDERRKNMRGAFQAPRPLDPTHLYIVIDDVITTGATLQAAVDALSSAGAEHILPIALAH